jgi:alginate O-acetyltransferase complex protein AlgI
VRLPGNFLRPYLATSIADFWRRWHITLSHWLRDYIYIPLGGSRDGTGPTIRNVIITMAIGGMWHGANWTFLIWGLYHGALMLIERATGWGAVSAVGWRSVLRRGVTFLLVVVGWVFFRAESVGQALTMLRHMVVPSGVALPDAVAVTLTNTRSVVLVLALLVVLLPGSFVLGRTVEAGRSRPAAVTRFAVMAVAGPYAAVLVAAGTFSPFLYYQF